jgi:hypothetical protein
MKTKTPISAPDRKRLRDLAKKVAEIAALPVMGERRQLWKKHNSLQRVRPMVLVFPEGAWRELLPDSALACAGKEARRIEAELRRRIYTREHFHDDTVCVTSWVLHKSWKNSGWGLEPKWRPATEAQGARGFDPVLRTPADLKKLRRPEISLDERETRRRMQEMQDLFGDLLDVQLRGITTFSIHIMSQYTALRGLDQVMMDMVENPAMLHDAMAFYAEAHRDLIRQYERLRLFSLNNDNSYHSSGGNGWTDELPKPLYGRANNEASSLRAPGFNPDHVRPRDLWASAEAQEMALVSPEMHEEFILSYERKLLAPFGLNGYGCCEDLTRKLDYVFRIPGIRRISISPFADVDACAEKLKGRYIFSWKPRPSDLVGDFNPKRVRDYIAHALRAAEANGCVLEIILKDTHTCDGHPERFTEWTRIARQLIQDDDGFFAADLRG